MNLTYHIVKRKRFRMTKLLAVVGVGVFLFLVGRSGRMEHGMEIIGSDKFRVSVPKKYKVIRHDSYKEQTELLNEILQHEEGNEEIIAFVKKHPPDLDAHKGFYYYEVKMGKHSLIFHTEIGDREPEGMAEYIQSQTRHLPVLEDVEYSGVKGKKYGSDLKEMSWFDIWLKEGDCMICIGFQGLGVPSDEIKEDVSGILNSLEYIP